MQHMTAQQQEVFAQLEAQGLSSYVWNKAHGVVSFARGDFGAMGSAPTSGIQAFLQEFGSLFGPTNISDVSGFLRLREDSLDWKHFEFQQVYALSDQPVISAPTHNQRNRLINVEHAFLSFHVNARGHLVEVQSSCWRDAFVHQLSILDLAQVRERLIATFVRGPNVGQWVDRLTPDHLNDIVMKGDPVLVVYAFEAGFRLAWKIRGPVALPAVLGIAAPQYMEGVIFLDASTGELLYRGVPGADVDTPDSGSGLSNLPFGGPFSSRPLEIVRVDASTTYRLRDTTHERDIVTYDWAGESAEFENTGSMLSNGSVDVSSDTDGDKTWDVVAADNSDAELAAAQQSEVDVHFNVGKVYEWYNAIAGAGGRAGFDDGNYGTNVPADMPVHAIAHVGWPSAFFYMLQDDDLRHVSYINFSDTIADDGKRAWSASPFVVCHEYQHGITAHSVNSSEPGFDSAVTDWARAVTEGLSDVFGGLYTGQWYAATDLSPEGLMLRNLAFPRDTETLSSAGLDHYDDRGGAASGPAYPRGQILAHCAYLMSQGGVHQRAGRNPELIPVHGLGTEESAGLDVAVAARIWYRMMATRFGAIPDINSETGFQGIRTECESSAIDLYGEGSREHRTLVQAFYAVGLHPPGESYGPDVTALRWGYSWRFSRPYLGIPSPDWASPDLFINNGGTSDWNAIVNAEGSEVNFENAIYCRVRNVGDQASDEVSVEFEYAKHGTAPVVWMSVENAAGDVQTLDLPSLAAGGSNFDIEAQDTPPESARVLWSIPPLADGEEVDHYCIRATITSDGDVNPHNGVIQSNVAYSVMSGMMQRAHAFNIGNPTDHPLPAELTLSHTLPVGWSGRIRENLGDIILDPGTERTLHLDIARPDGSSPDDDTLCLPPFDGELRGEIWGTLAGPVTGTLTNVSGTAAALKATIALHLKGGGLLTGNIDGALDCERAVLSANVVGTYQCLTGSIPACVQIKACLRPYRRIEIRQSVEGRVLGGITVQIQVPMPAHCDWPHAPTRTSCHMDDKSHGKQGCDDKPCENQCGEFIYGKVAKICYDYSGDFEGFLLEDCATSRMCCSREPAAETVVIRAFRDRLRLGVKLDPNTQKVWELCVAQ